MKKYLWVAVSVFLLILVVATGCGGGAVAKDGDTVKVHYTGTLDDGTQFDSSIGKDPLQFTLGQHQMIAGFESAVLGMKVGETKKVKIPADQAYGQRRDDFVFDVDKSKLPTEPEIGMQFNMKLQDGSSVIVKVTAVNDNTVTLDANPELAGKDLTFEIKLVEITKAK
jgi:peptidylprolyl isomerase